MDEAIESFELARYIYADLMVDYISAGKTLVNVAHVEEKRGDL